MSRRRLFTPSISVLAILMVAAPLHSAIAQGKFAGTWTVDELVSPDWIEPTSPQPGQPLKLGDKITFEAASVTAPEPFACGKAVYREHAIDSTQIFRGGIPDSAKVAEVAQRFGFSSAAAALLVECELTTFEFYLGQKGLVVEYDNMAYVLSREVANRKQ